MDTNGLHAGQQIWPGKVNEGYYVDVNWKMQKARFVFIPEIKGLVWFFLVLIAATLIARLTTPLVLMTLSSDMAYDALPAQYPFLFFPKPGCNLVRNTGGQCPSRAILASKEEYEAGEVQFSTSDGKENWIDSAELSLLPEKNDMQLLENWKRHLRVADGTDGDWQSRKLDADEFEIQVKLTDHQNSRLEEYRYILKDRKLKSAKNIAFGAVDLLISTVIIMLGIIFSLILARFLMVWLHEKKCLSKARLQTS